MREIITICIVSVAALVLALSHQALAEDGNPSQVTRLYVGNSGSSSVSVIDHTSREVIKTISIGARHHGSVPSSTGDRIYLTTEDTGEVIAVDTLTNEILWRVKAGTMLHEPSITHDDKFVIAPDFRAGRLAVIDAQSGQLIDEIKMTDPSIDAKFDGLHNTYEMPDGIHMLSMSIMNKSMIKINMNTREIVRIYRLNGQPRPAAIMKNMSTIFVQLSELNGFIAVDLETGKEIKRIEWPFEGELPDGVGAWTPSHGLSLTIDNTEVWAASAFTSQLYVYSVPELEKLAVVDIGVLPNWIAVSNDGNTLYATSQEPGEERGSVTVIDIATRKVSEVIKVGRGPKRIHLVDLPSPS